jgi:hypothetical protein
VPTDETEQEKKRFDFSCCLEIWNEKAMEMVREDG